MTATPPSIKAGRVIAVAGNPNCGKSTLFNSLTGLRQKVGNYPGVTVEKKVGRAFGSHGQLLELVDLPGTYSLNTRSPDEQVARDVLLGRQIGEARPDAVLVVVDATNLERNLYFAAQVLELGLPVVIALNMVDLAEAAGTVVDLPALSESLGAPVIPTVATAGRGLVEIRQALSRPATGAGRSAPMLPVIENAARQVATALVQARLAPETAARAEALLLLTLGPNDPQVLLLPSPVVDALTQARTRIESLGIDPAGAIVDSRYAWVQEVLSRSVRGGSARAGAQSISDRLDAWLTHRVWGWVFFIAVMGLLFASIFSFATIPMGWIEAGQEAAATWLAGHMQEGDLRSLLIDGVLGGVGGVLVFLPQILLLFLFIGLLEDTGYLSRAAFIIDRLMNRVGLQGKSFVPLLSSFACAIPGVMAARTIENRNDRLVTILVAPLMSCSARLPVYALLVLVLLGSEASAWAKAGLTLLLYGIGMAAAFCMAWFFRRTLFRGGRAMLLLEMPPYRWPSWRGLGLRLLERGGLFVRRAGTLILAISILIWAVSTYPRHPDPAATPSEALAYSYAGRVGKAIEPVIDPLGYDWKIGVGLVSSFAAREVFVSTMSILYSIEGEGEAEAGLDAQAARVTQELHGDGRRVYTPLVCLGLMVFYVLAMQCVSTLVIVRRETNSWKWPLFQLAYMTLLAYSAAFVIYQGGRLLGFE